jgi:hypothetical protein
VDAWRDQIRFRRALAPDGSDAFVEGTDFAQVAEGRLHRVTGFSDRCRRRVDDRVGGTGLVGQPISASLAAELLKRRGKADFAVTACNAGGTP